MSADPARPYLHAEAFAVMQYRSVDGSETEEVWNSRDGVTPFAILLRSGKEAVHVNWSSDVSRPDYQPPAGSRIFVDLTEEIAQANAQTYVRRIWDNDGAEGMLARSQFETVEAMVAALTADLKPGEPALVEVPEEGWTR